MNILKKIKYLIIGISFWSNGIINAQNYTISGYVVDKESRETIIGASVILKGTIKGTSTDINGFFQVPSCPAGKYTLVFSHVGYLPFEKNIILENKSLLLNEVELELHSTSIGEISVVGIKPQTIGDKEIETSQLELTPKAIESIPSARNDIFKAIKYLPGIEGAEAFSPLYSVRGGDPGENKVILDGVTIYNPYHFATSAGIFNVQTIKNIEILIGGYGAEFGGSNSSILHITTKEGNKNELHGELFPSLTQSNFLLEFPAGKNASMMVGGRYFYDLSAAFVLYNQSYFYDFNIAYTNRINNKNWISVKVFQSKDDTQYDFGKFFSYIGNSFDYDFYKEMDMGINNQWQNLAASVNLKKILTPVIYMNSQIYYSKHQSANYSYMDMPLESSDFTIPMDLLLKYNTKFNSFIEDICFKTDINIRMGNHNNIRTGVEKSWYYFENQSIINDIDNKTQSHAPHNLALFVEDKIKIGPLIFRPGLRLVNYSYYQDFSLEPRFNLSLHITESFLFKAAYGHYYQHIISMNTMEYEVNQFLDYYYPLKDTEPSKSIHYIAGFEQKLYNNHLTFKTDVYYKDIQRTYTFDLSLNIDELYTFSDKIKAGSGSAYGMELMLEGNMKKFSGWIGYAFSKSFRSFPHIMDGQSYPFEYNRLHSFNTLINYQINNRLSYSTTLLVMSGQPRTIEKMFQNSYRYDPATGKTTFFPIYVSDVKNNARLPMAIEWDIGIKKQLRNGFGADLQEFIKADESYINITIGNLTFLRRNVSWYFPNGGKKFFPVGFNYIPYINAGYILRF